MNKILFIDDEGWFAIVPGKNGKEPGYFLFSGCIMFSSVKGV